MLGATCELMVVVRLESSIGDRMGDAPHYSRWLRNHPREPMVPVGVIPTRFLTFGYIDSSMARLLTLSGSLRDGSSNTVVLAAAGLLAPAGLTVSPFGALAQLPAFNPDLDDDANAPPPPVAHWRSALRDADMVLISSPEYAHGIPGALKNALDWVVGSGELVGKPVGVVNPSASSRFAFPQLVEVLTVMSAAVIPEATVIIDLPRRGLTAAQLAADESTAQALRSVLAALLAATPDVLSNTP